MRENQQCPSEPWNPHLANADDFQSTGREESRDTGTIRTGNILEVSMAGIGPLLWALASLIPPGRRPDPSLDSSHGPGSRERKPGVESPKCRGSLEHCCELHRLGGSGPALQSPHLGGLGLTLQEEQRDEDGHFPSCPLDGDLQKTLYLRKPEGAAEKQRGAQGDLG